MSALELTAEAYHRDDCGDTPTLSASIAYVLTTQSPAHAFAKHPRLNPNYERTTEDKFDVGTVVHSLILEGVDSIHVVDAKNWTTNAAKAERDEARAAGKIPLLISQTARVREMVDAIGRQLDAFDLKPRPFTNGDPEVCLTFELEGVKCRALIDWLHIGGSVVCDLKTTGASAHPLAWAKTAMGIGADVQVAMHSMGVEAVYGVVPAWRYVVVETYPPFALSVVEPDAQMVALGTDKVRAALRLWRDCLGSGEWPGYPPAIQRISPPGWATAQWMEHDEVGEVFVG